MLGTNTAINAAMIAQMRAASRRRDGEIVLLGHGECVPDKNFQVPVGTTVVFYTPPNAYLRGVDVRAIPAPEVWGLYQRPRVQETRGPGQTAQEHLIGELEPRGIGHKGPPGQLGGTWMSMSASPRKLSTILQPNMGTVHYAACRCLPEAVADADLIAFNAGEGQNEPGSEPLELTDEQLRVLAEKGGRPSE